MSTLLPRLTIQNKLIYLPTEITTHSHIPPVGWIKLPTPPVFKPGEREVSDDATAVLRFRDAQRVSGISQNASRLFRGRGKGGGADVSTRNRPFLGRSGMFYCKNGSDFQAQTLSRVTNIGWAKSKSSYSLEE